MIGGCFSKKCPFLSSFFLGGKRNDSSMMMLCDGIVMLCDAKVISKLLVNKLYTMFYVDMCDDDGIFFINDKRQRFIL